LKKEKFKIIVDFISLRKVYFSTTIGYLG